MAGPIATCVANMTAPVSSSHGSAAKLRVAAETPTAESSAAPAIVSQPNAATFARLPWRTIVSRRISPPIPSGTTATRNAGSGPIRTSVISTSSSAASNDRPFGKVISVTYEITAKASRTISSPGLSHWDGGASHTNAGTRAIAAAPCTASATRGCLIRFNTSARKRIRRGGGTTYPMGS